MEWITFQDALAIHDELITRFGGLPGLSGKGLLLSALARPEQAICYSDPDIADLAGIYAVAIAKNHAFADGNKRTAFFVAATFLELNGFVLTLPEPEATLLMLNIASGQINEQQAAAIFRASMKRP
jgi:death-on-curing protein